MKYCRRCNQDKPLTAFGKHGAGYMSHCKVCKSESDRLYRIENSPALKEAARKKYQRNKARDPEGVRIKSREAVRKWRADNPSKALAASRRHQRPSEHLKQWREKNRERFLETQRLYRAANKEKVSEWDKANQARRRSNLSDMRCDFTPAQWKEMKRRYHNRCFYCGEKKPLTRDHVIPIARGGEHTWVNILPACKNCNSRKGTKSAEEFMFKDSGIFI